MSNFFNLRCPQCGKEDEIDIQASVWLRLTSDGTDADASACGDHIWDNDSPAECAACSYAGPVKLFAAAGDEL